MGGFRKRDAVHLRDVRGRRARALGLPAHVGLLLQGRGPRLHHQPRRRLRGAGRGRLPGRRRSPPSTRSAWSFASSSATRCPRRASSRAATSPTASPLNPAHRRARGHRRRLPRPRAPRGRAVLADEGRDGPARRARRDRRSGRDPGPDRHARALPRAHLRELALHRTTFPPTPPSGTASAAGGIISVLGIAAGLRGLRAPARHHASSCVTASSAVHNFLSHKWYFDELYRRRRSSGRCRHRRLVRAPRDRDRLRAGLHRRRRHRASCGPAPPSRARSRPATCAPTRCCCCSAWPDSSSTS